jgi:hypothetical protein
MFVILICNKILYTYKTFVGKMVLSFLKKSMPFVLRTSGGWDIDVVYFCSQAPVVISRDHHDVSGADSPYRETANITDGSAFTAGEVPQDFKHF